MDDPANIGGFGILDNNNPDTNRIYTIPAGTVITPRKFFVIERGTLGFGLGDAETLTLFAWDHRSPVNRFSWNKHASTTYGRCPDGTGDFVTTTRATKGEVNACGGAP